MRVAQLDRALGYGPRCREFESSHARRFLWLSESKKHPFEGAFFCIIGNSKEFPITQKCTNVPMMCTCAKMQVVASDALGARMCQGSNCSQVGIFWTENSVRYSSGSRFCRFRMCSIGKIPLMGTRVRTVTLSTFFIPFTTARNWLFTAWPI